MLIEHFLDLLRDYIDPYIIKTPINDLQLFSTGMAQCLLVSLYFTAFGVLALHQSYYVEELAIQPSYSLPRISHYESRKCIHINLAVYLSQLP